MVGVLISGSSSTDPSPGQGHCVVFLGKTLYSHSASLHLHVGEEMGTGKFSAGGCWGGGMDGMLALPNCLTS